MLFIYYRTSVALNVDTKLCKKCVTEVKRTTQKSNSVYVVKMVPPVFINP